MALVNWNAHITFVLPYWEMAVSNGCEAGVEDDWVLDSLDR